MTDAPSIPEVTLADELGYAVRLARALHEKHYATASPNWEPLPDLLGVLTQIDNMTSGLGRAASEDDRARLADEFVAAWRASPPLQMWNWVGENYNRILAALRTPHPVAAEGLIEREASLWKPADAEKARLGWPYDFDEIEAVRDKAREAAGYDATLEFAASVMEIADQRLRARPPVAVPGEVGLRDLLTAAYKAGALDVHMHLCGKEVEREADFTEAASDYADFALTSPDGGRNG